MIDRGFDSLDFVVWLPALHKVLIFLQGAPSTGANLHAKLLNFVPFTGHSCGEIGVQLERFVSFAFG